MEKLTEAEVVKALECCISGKLRPCDNCPYRNNCRNGVAMKTDALDLIKRKDAEIERLKAEIRNTDNHLVSLDRPLIEVKSEAYKEFAEIVLKATSSYTHCNKNSDYTNGFAEAMLWFGEMVKDTLKELTEGNNG